MGKKEANQIKDETSIRQHSVDIDKQISLLNWYIIKIEKLKNRDETTKHLEDYDYDDDSFIRKYLEKVLSTVHRN